MSSHTSVFNAWREQSLDEALAHCREVIEDGDYSPVQRWRESGGKVLGHFQVYFPQEIAHAAGMLPVKLRGAPVELIHADSRFGSYLCSILKSSLDLALSGEVQLDMFVSHPICDAARNLAAIWSRNFDYPCQILYLPQNANSEGTIPYLREEYGRLLSTVEEVSGKKVTEEDLRHSIGLFDRSRALVRELYDLKRSEPWKVAAEDAYCLVAIGGLIPVEEHIALLERVIPELQQRENKTIGRSCYVVDDDFLIGLRWFTEAVGTDGDPLLALAEAYIERSGYSPVQHDDRKVKEAMLLERAKAADAEAVILTAAKMCEPGLEEQVAYVLALDESRIPYFLSEFEESMTSFRNLELQVETFAENLLFI